MTGGGTLIEFDYTIQDPQGLHARPAGRLVKFVQDCSSKVSVTLGGKTVDAKRLFGIMSLCAKKGDGITVKLEGEKEASDSKDLKKFCEETF